MRLILFVYLFICLPAFAETTINGLINKNKLFTAYYEPAAIALPNTIEFKFPRPRYSVRSLYATDLSYEKVKGLRRYSFRDYPVLNIDGSLELIEYNEETQMCSFRLIIYPSYLSSNGFTKTINERVSGSINLSENQPFCLIHGKYVPGDKPKFINIPKPGDCKVKINEISRYQELLILQTTENMYIKTTIT